MKKAGKKRNTSEIFEKSQQENATSNIITLPSSHSKPPRHRRYRKWPQESLLGEPRAFDVDTLSSAPQLNAIMDRAMGKVKSMINELEDEKGRLTSKF